MERAKQFLEPSKEESSCVSKVVVNPHVFQAGPSFYDSFALKGLRVDRIGPRAIFGTFKVPPRLIDRDGNLAAGAIASLVDLGGSAMIHRVGQPLRVSVSMSISYFSSAKLDDELEVSSRLVGKTGAVSGTSVVIKNKANGDIVAQGRLSLLSKL